MSELPYRQCVGILLINRQGLVWMGQRKGAPNDPEGVGHWWQMPQGGVDKGEDSLTAARRELLEETNVTSVELIHESPRDYRYDFPPRDLSNRWLGRYRGQQQRWFCFRFTGDDREINIAQPNGGRNEAEFDAWRWVPLAEIDQYVVAFKRDIYRALQRDFVQSVHSDTSGRS